MSDNSDSDVSNRVETLGKMKQRHKAEKNVGLDNSLCRRGDDFVSFLQFEFIGIEEKMHTNDAFVQEI